LIEKKKEQVKGSKMQTLLGRQWHHLPVERVRELLDTDLEQGLDRFEVHHRQERFGPNRLTPAKGISPVKRFLLQFHNPLIYILLAASLVTVLVKGELVDAGIILAVVLVNALIGYIQESKAEKAIQALHESLTSETTVIRAGQAQRISAEQLVPGDLVTIKSGDRVPADLRLVRQRDLQIAEAALTGESLPVEKSLEDDLPVEMPLGDRRNMAYASTLVTFGQGRGVVIATGDNTEIGRISQLISSAKELVTPLQRKIAQFSKLLLWVILALAAITFLVGLLRGQPAIDTFTAAIALAVAAIPEGLPAALTVTLAIGVSRMARRRAIIRKLPAVETLGSVTVIASDKTGTLTQNQMTVQEIALPRKEFQLSGTGYDPAGEISEQDRSLGRIEHSGLREILTAGLLCNDSSLVKQDNRWLAEGDPTEAALITAALKGGLDEKQIKRELPRLDEIPFDSQHQYMATLHERGQGLPSLAYIKGAVEVVLERSKYVLDEQGRPQPVDREKVLRQAEGLAAKGLRVLAFARVELPPHVRTLTHESLAQGLTFLGLQGMIDPPRPEAIAAIQASQNAGIRIKMITGDHALTAATIAGQLGLASGAPGELPQVMTGRELARLTDRELVEAAQNTHVFARVSPEQKLRLVEALQARGEVVAMTGDGVNDAPALKQADIGIAMGITGTDVSKEAAEMVLIDDNFATIEAAVEEGRGVFDNLTKIIAWTLPTNLGEGLIILAAILLGTVLPILPLQILWINMVTVATLGLVLALEMRESDIMSRPPRNPSEPILTRTLLWRILIVGILILIGAFGLFEWELMQGGSLAAARTVAVNAVIMVEIFYLFNARSLTQSPFQIGLFSNRWAIAGVLAMLLLQWLFTYTPWMNELFASAPISVEAWGRILLFAFAGFWLIEIEKWIRRRAQNSLNGKPVSFKNLGQV
jgi:cation-transporting P-type ATPase F